MNKLDTLLKKAEALDGNDAKLAARLEMVRMQYRFLWLGTHFDEMYNGSSADRVKIVELNTAFKNDCICLGLCASEGGKMNQYSVRNSVFAWTTL